MMRVISLGWGVQSFALAAMSALGELPSVDVAIHADTTHERSETYAFAAKWTPWLEERGVRVVTVSASIPFPKTKGVFIPAYTVSLETGTHGQLRRSCTQRWKIAPIRRWLQAHRETQVEMWLGITLDEWTRMKDSTVNYITNHYPFMEFDSPWSRLRVMQWLESVGLEIPCKSACVFCPYRNLHAWREVRDSDNGDWTKAVEVDREIRNKRPGYIAYLHRSCRPLDWVDLRNEQDHGQLTLWDEEECSGMCFL